MTAKSRWRSAIFAVLSLVGAFDVSARAAPSISDLVPITLRSGVNHISRLGPDGRDGMIVLGWRENGNAHGYDVALVLVPSGPGGGWNVAKVELPDKDPWAGWQDGVRDDPHTGDDFVRAFRFVRGRVDGREAVLLLIASRDPGASIPDPSNATFQVFRLVHEPEVGTTPDHFALVQQDRSTSSFCNAEMALTKRFALPLRTSYNGPTTANGCR